MRIACWTTKPTDTREEYVILTAFHSNNVYTKAPQCYVIRTLPFLFIKQCSLRLLKFLSIITTIRRLTLSITTICPYVHHMLFVFVFVTTLETNSCLEISPMAYFLK